MSLIPIVNRGFIIPQSMDEINRSKLTLKRLREIAKEKDIDICGPKGGLLTKKPLLVRIEERYLKEEAEKQAEKDAKRNIIIEHHKEKIAFEEQRIKGMKQQTMQHRIKAGDHTKKADEIEAEIEELRILINVWKKEYVN